MHDHTHRTAILRQGAYTVLGTQSTVSKQDPGRCDTLGKLKLEPTGLVVKLKFFEGDETFVAKADVSQVLSFWKITGRISNARRQGLGHWHGPVSGTISLSHRLSLES